MATKQRKKSQRTANRRAGWRGQLVFGLVSFEVKALNAIDRQHGDIHFHQLHASCHSRIHHEKVCPIHGKVSNDEIVSGYEYKKGQYIEIEPEELDALRTENERALKIDSFVRPEAIDPIYFDRRLYYLLPAGLASRQPYAVLVEALERENRYGVGQVAFSGKDQIAAVRSLDGLLQMAMLRHAAEIRSPNSVGLALKTPKAIAREVKLAQSLIQRWAEDNPELSKYQDSYRDKAMDLITAKLHGHEPPAPVEEKPTEVLNLMEALKKSLEAMAHQERAGSKRAKNKSA